MADTDVFLQLEKRRQASSAPSRTAARGAKRQRPARKRPAAAKSPAKPAPSLSAQAQDGAPRSLEGDTAHPLGDEIRPQMKPGRQAVTAAGRRDGTADVGTDVTTSLLYGVSRKLWRERIEETETHNSSLRLSAQERDQIEDVVRDLRRQYRIKTSMNEMARLGLLLLAHDFRQRGRKSIVAAVKTS